MDLSIIPSISAAVSFILIINEITNTLVLKSDQYEELIYEFGTSHTCCSDTPLGGYLGAEANLSLYIKNYENISAEYEIFFSDEFTNSGFKGENRTLLKFKLNGSEFKKLSLQMPSSASYEIGDSSSWLSKLYISTGFQDNIKLGMFTIIHDAGIANPNWTDNIFPINLTFMVLGMFSLIFLRKQLQKRHKRKF
ncbi:MAG: hypothetical protein IH840_13215 [Candidatus Heimdallarchaeota archaeon]|nr:hypothetical protein [Candidatus Heimdallarchaeota archaeon]